LAAERLLTKYFSEERRAGNVLLMEDDPDAAYRLVSEGVEELARVAEVYASDAFGGMKIHPPAVVSVGVRVDAGLLRLRFDLDGLDLAELPGILASYRAKKKYHRLRDGSFLPVEDTALGGLSEIAEGFDLSAAQLAEGNAALPASRALYLDAVCKQNEDLRLERDAAFKKILRDVREVENADFPPPEALRGVLRKYQKTGFRWLKTVAAYGFGGILADDMGLGKTLQVLALLKSRYEEEQEKAPSIVVCPSSLTLNWESEAQKFTPELKTLVVGGSAAERAEKIARANEFDVLITSYDLLRRDAEAYGPFRFAFVVIDEAQYIKNQNTRNAKAVKSLNGAVRFALTGTPVENSLAELWSIFDFLMPGYLFSYRRFLKKFEEPIVKKGDVEAAERLRQLARPFLLRRLKKDVLKELPPKTETVLRVSMGEAQRKLYAALAAQTQKAFSGASAAANASDKLAIFAALTRLRQICCDPSLVYEKYACGSAKLDSCMETLENCLASGSRVLLFSQFTSMLDIIEAKLGAAGIGALRIDGSTPPAERLALVNRFNAGEASVFLISLKAGGTGLNLTGADVVIHYDPWWNLSAQNQATDRAHRIGQKNAVQVYKLIVKNAIEERILKMQERKAELADVALKGSGNPFEKLSRDELLALLET
jgi:SNF2 family DNA or RNA helicase